MCDLMANNSKSKKRLRTRHFLLTRWVHSKKFVAGGSIILVAFIGMITIFVHANSAVNPVLWDHFQRSDRNLDKDISPSGLPYVTHGHDAPVIRNKKYIRSNLGLAGPDGSSILMMPHGYDPTIVGESFVFTPGSTLNQNAVIGTCDVGLGTSSVQFAVWPDHWEMFTVELIDGAVTYTTIAKGENSPALKIDGTTKYVTRMQYHQATSSVTVSWGEGQSQTFTSADPVTGITANWGTYAVAQVRRPHTTDGDVQFIAFGSN